MSTKVVTKGADVFAVTWKVKIMKCIGLPDTTWQCDPESSPIKWANRMKSMRQERTVVRPDDRIEVWSDLTDEHLVRTDDGIVCARCVRRANEQSPRHHRSQSRPRWTRLLYLNLQLFLPRSQSPLLDTCRRTPKLDPIEDEDTRDKTVFELTQRWKARRSSRRHSRKKEERRCDG